MTRQVSKRFLESIPGVNRWKSTLEWSNDGGQSWSDPVATLDGQVTEDNTSQIHWQARSVVVDAPSGSSGINATNTRVRIKQGIQWGPGDEELLDLGTYRVINTSESIVRPGRLTIDGDSKECYVIDGPTVEPKTMITGSAQTMLYRLLSLVFSSPTIAWDASIDRAKLVPELVVERDVWGLITHVGDASSIANALGALVYPSARDVWTVDRTPSLEDAIAWRLSSSDLLFDAGEDLSIDGVHNQIVVTGTGDQLVGPVVVSDNNRESPTYVGRPIEQGGCGRRPAFYESSLITDEAQAKKVGQARLARSLGMKQQVKMTHHYDPTREAGDVGEVTGARTVRVILDAVDYNLGPTPEPMQARTRTTATQLLGEANFELPEEGGE